LRERKEELKKKLFNAVRVKAHFAKADSFMNPVKMISKLSDKHIVMNYLEKDVDTPKILENVIEK
jgi:hypothetical protein